MIWENIRLNHEYFTQIDISKECFNLERCQYCGAIGTLPPLSMEDLKKYYSCQYAAHSQLHQEINRSLPVLMRIRNIVTKPFVSIFFTKVSLISRVFKRVLISRLFPRMFRGFPVLFNKPKTLLDIGCGDGSFLYQIKQMPCKSYGFEISSRAVAIAHGAGLDVMEGTIDKLTEVFSNQRFDVIRIVDVLEHTTTPGKVIRHIHDLLNKNGEVIVSVPNFRAFSKRLFGKYWPVLHLPFHRFHFDYSVLKNVLEKNGFTVKIIFTKNTLQILYGIEYYLQHKHCHNKGVTIFTKLMYAPIDILLDCIFPLWGDSIEIHAVRQD